MLIPKVHVHDGLTERQRIILDIIKSNDVITLAQMSTIVGVSKKTIQRDIALMNDVVKRVGGEKSGHWEIDYSKIRQNSPK